MYVACGLLLCVWRVRFEMRANAWATSCKVPPTFSPDIKQSHNMSTNFSEILSLSGLIENPFSWCRFDTLSQTDRRCYTFRLSATL